MRANTLVLIAGCMALLVHHFFFFYGHFGFDDLYYARLAHQLLEGSFDTADQYSYRLVPLLLIALSYSILGVNDLASALPALLASFGIICLFYYLFRGEAWWKLLLCIALYFGTKWNVFYSDKLMPDLFVSVFAFAGWAAYERYRRLPIAGKKVGILAAGALFLAFNSKGTIILLAPVFLLYLLWNVSRKQVNFWLGLIPVCFALFFCYFLITYAATGSAVARFTAISSTHYLNPCSYDSLPREILYDRLTNGFWELIVNAGLLVHLLIAFITVGVLVYRRSPNCNNLFYPFTVITSLLSINFMTISLSSYNPVCLDPRHILLFTPILSVCSVRSLSLLFGYRRLDASSVYVKTTLVLVAVGLCLPAINQALYGRTLEYSEVKQAYDNLIDRAAPGTVFFGSEVTKNFGDYFTAFEGQSRPVMFKNVDELTPCENGTGDDNLRSMLLRNWYSDWHAGVMAGSLAEVAAKKGYVLEPSPLEVDRLQLDVLSCP